jgi:hypothetical protein
MTVTAEDWFSSSMEVRVAVISIPFSSSSLSAAGAVRGNSNRQIIIKKVVTGFISFLSLEG